MTYRYCRESMWFRVIDSETPKIYLTPLVGKLLIVDWRISMGESFEGIFTVESRLGTESLQGFLEATSELPRSQEEILSRWLRSVWSFNEVSPDSRLPEWMDIPSTIELFRSYDQNLQERILEAIDAFIDVQEQELRKSQYLEREEFSPLLEERDVYFLQEGSQAHVTAVTHKKHKDEARRAAEEVFRGVSEAVKESVEDGDASRTVVTPSFGDIDPLAITTIIGIAERADLVRDGRESAEQFAGSEFGITQC